MVDLVHPVGGGDGGRSVASAAAAGGCDNTYYIYIYIYIYIERERELCYVMHTFRGICGEVTTRLHVCAFDNHAALCNKP